jgi:hypothetical protein
MSESLAIGQTSPAFSWLLTQGFDPANLEHRGKNGDTALMQAKSPEAIAEYFPIVTLEQVYATILYYLQHRESVSQYIADWLGHSLKAEAEQEANPPLIVERLQQLKQSKLAA